MSFPLVTLREWALVCEAAGIRDARQAWMAASYISFAFHDPQNMPDAPDVRKPEPGQNTEAELVQIKAWMKAKAGAL